MAHFFSDQLQLPDKFNFARDVVDFWASQSPSLRAMRWISQDAKDMQELDFAHFSRQSQRISNLLYDLGLKRGDILIVILPRIPTWWELSVACIRSGIILCPATTLLTDRDIEFRCQVSKATAIVGDEKVMQKISNVRQNCPQLQHLIYVSASANAESFPSPIIDFNKRLQQIPDNATFDTIDSSRTDPALIYFTSGTSGPPKMVQHSSVSYPLAHTLTGKHWLKLRPGQLYWNLSEQGWAKAAWSFFGAWNCGAALFIFDDRGAFRADNIINMLHHHPITVLCAPPTAYRQLVLPAAQRLLSERPSLSLEHCVGAGEPLNGHVIESWQRMTGMTIKDGYGQTETVLICGNFLDFPTRPGSMGKPTPGVTLCVLDENLKEAPCGQEGSMAVLLEKPSANNPAPFFGIFDGYISKEFQVTRKTVRANAGTANEKTWYLTGDRAYRDEDGYLWFVGRSDDVINSAGYRIGPFEVESTLKQHPSVVESAVVASPDDARGEVVKAFVVLTEEYANKDHDTLRKELQDFCKEKAAPYKYPRRIQFVDGTFLPKTISGKIKRGELKAAEWKKPEPKAKL